ncbi:MAG: ribosome maturation factor RimM [Rickettsiales bacterium]|jgi:16S rRNA processing protein RimM|nr:ribosome maturation factor RimM [Rickettsiales bacterium]
MNDTQKILVGKIVAAQGLRGEVRVHTYTQSPLDFAKLAIINEQLANKKIKFIRAVPNSPVAILKIAGVDDRNAAEALRGTELFVNRSDMPALPDGEFYQTDLIGCAVLRDDEKIGAVAAMYNFGAGDILELNNGDMISFAGADVDLPRREIKVK